MPGRSCLCFAVLLLFICAYACVDDGARCVQFIQWISSIERNAMQEKRNNMHKSQTHTRNECDRDGQQRRLYASIEQININVHWMEIWQHIFLSDNMKYGNSPQHSTDSQRQTYTRKQPRKEGKPKRTRRAAAAAHTHTSSLARSNVPNIFSHIDAMGEEEKKRQSKRKVCGCITATAAAASMAAMAATTPQYLR